MLEKEAEFDRESRWENFKWLKEFLCCPKAAREQTRKWKPTAWVAVTHLTLSGPQEVSSDTDMTIEVLSKWATACLCHIGRSVKRICTYVCPLQLMVFSLSDLVLVWERCFQPRGSFEPSQLDIWQCLGTLWVVTVGEKMEMSQVSSR